jgi:hypothetical protein
MSNILVGCDPEVFVKQGGLFKSAHGLIKGDKKDPQKIPYGAVQVDGMALEFNINPAATEDEFVLNVTQVFTALKAMVPEYEVVATPVADFDPAYMKAQPEEALELGCDPDYNGWTGQANPRPDGDRPFRTASGHVHIGWTDNQSTEGKHRVQALMAARQMDFFLGLPSLFYDTDVKRRELYGKAGALRVKTYGMEYRTLSNAWLNSESLMRWVFASAKAGMEALMGGWILEEEFGDVQEIINTSNVKKASAIIEKAGLPVPKVA